MPSLTLKPGSPIRLKGQPKEIPDFLVIRCSKDRCWVRQSKWNPEVELAIQITQIDIPNSDELVLPGNGYANVISLGLYRFRKNLRRYSQ